LFVILWVNAERLVSNSEFVKIGENTIELIKTP